VARPKATRTAHPGNLHGVRLFSDCSLFLADSAQVPFHMRSICLWGTSRRITRPRLSVSAAYRPIGSSAIPPTCLLSTSVSESTCRLHDTQE
jgi:hypothetical protein